MRFVLVLFCWASGIALHAQPFILRWDAITNQTWPVKSYSIFSRTGTNRFARIGQTTNTFWDLGPNPTRDCWFGVSATYASTSSNTIESAISPLAYLPPPAPVNVLLITNLLNNGDFEAGTNQWHITGHAMLMSITDWPNLAGLSAAKCLVLNSGNSRPNALVRQSFPTERGKAYAIELRMGGISPSRSAEQRLKLAVHGRGPLFTNVFAISLPKAPNAHWTTQEGDFTADSTRATITLSDVSLETDAVDLLLDAVSVTAK